MPRPRPRSRRRPTRSVAMAAIKVLDERLREVEDKRLRRLEQALGLDRKPIGFDATAAIGDRIEQDVEDPEVEELP